jgi:hypothetical protein
MEDTEQTKAVGVQAAIFWIVEVRISSPDLDNSDEERQGWAHVDSSS